MEVNAKKQNRSLKKIRRRAANKLSCQTTFVTSIVHQKLQLQVLQVNELRVCVHMLLIIKLLSHSSLKFNGKKEEHLKCKLLPIKTNADRKE